MWLLIVAACPAEQLGIELPPGGAGAISAEDLQRDVRGALGPDAEAFVRRRFEQMHLRLDGVCGERGEGELRAFVAGPPVDTDGAVAVAALISLAKAVDTSDPVPGRWRFCVGEGEGTRIGPLGAGPLAWEGDRVQAGAPDPARRPEQLDYRVVAEQVRAIWGRAGGS